MEIITLVVIIVLFVITWIVIAVNSPPYFPPPTYLNNEPKSFADSYQWAQMRADVNSIEARLQNMQMKNLRDCLYPIYETKETTISKLKDDEIIKELKRRNRIVEGNIIK
jgi:hypothetical protein